MNEFHQLYQQLPEAWKWDINHDLWQAVTERLKNRTKVEFAYPADTVPLKCTDSCELNCAHCGGEYLKHMKPLSEGNNLSAQSFLISGGCDPFGKVPVRKYLDQIAQLPPGHKLNFHVGLLSHEEAQELKGRADKISFDFVYDDYTIEQVYGLSVGKGEYLRAYQDLRRISQVVPHVCLGLLGGVIRGEWAALEKLAEEGADAIAFIVFIPTPNTAFAHKSPPPLGEVVELLARARLLFPDIPLNLGCMRPKGKYRNYLDAFALLAGIDTIVQPTPMARNLVKQFKWDTTLSKECCVL